MALAALKTVACIFQTDSSQSTLERQGRSLVLHAPSWPRKTKYTFDEIHDCRSNADEIYALSESMALNLRSASKSLSVWIGPGADDALFGDRNLIAKIIDRCSLSGEFEEPIDINLLAYERGGWVDLLETSSKGIVDLNDAVTARAKESTDFSHLLHLANVKERLSAHKFLRLSTRTGHVDILSMSGWADEAQSIELVELNYNLAQLAQAKTSSLSLKQPLTRVAQPSLESMTVLVVCTDANSNNFHETRAALEFPNEFFPVTVESSERKQSVEDEKDRTILELREQVRRLCTQVDTMHTHYQRLLEERGGIHGAQKAAEHTQSTREEAIPSESLSSTNVELQQMREALNKVKDEKAQYEQSLKDAQAELSEREKKVSELQLSVKQMEKRRSKELEDAERGKEELRQSMQLELKRCKEHFDQELKGIHHERISAFASEQGKAGISTHSASPSRQYRGSRKEAQEEYMNKINEAQQARNEEVNSLRDYYEGLLNRKQQEYEELRQSFESYKQDSERKLRKANEENAYLLCYSKHLGYLFEEIERRGYPVKQRKSYKSLIVPPRDKPGKVDLSSQCAQALETAERMPWLQRFLAAKEEGDKGRGELETGAASTSQAREEVRQEVEKQVIEELASDETVEYIRRLEEENAKSHRFLEEEKRKNTELRVALQSMHRSMASSPQSRSKSSQSNSGVKAEVDDMMHYTFSVRPPSETSGRSRPVSRRPETALSQRGKSHRSHSSLPAGGAKVARPQSTPP